MEWNWVYGEFGQNLLIDNLNEADFYLVLRQILPESYTKQSQISVETYDEALSDGKPIIVYVHGNTGSRATFHRVQLYKLLQKNECHVITFDYRST